MKAIVLVVIGVGSVVILSLVLCVTCGRKLPTLDPVHETVVLQAPGVDIVLNGCGPNGLEIGWEESAGMNIQYVTAERPGLDVELSYESPIFGLGGVATHARVPARMNIGRRVVVSPGVWSVVDSDVDGAVIDEVWVRGVVSAAYTVRFEENLQPCIGRVRFVQSGGFSGVGGQPGPESQTVLLRSANTGIASLEARANSKAFSGSTLAGQVWLMRSRVSSVNDVVIGVRLQGMSQLQEKATVSIVVGHQLGLEGEQTLECNIDPDEDLVVILNNPIPWMVTSQRLARLDEWSLRFECVTETDKLSLVLDDLLRLED